VQGLRSQPDRQGHTRPAEVAGRRHANGTPTGNNSAAEVYELLETHGLLSARALSEREGLMALIQEVQAAFPKSPSPGHELWRDVEEALERAGFLSAKGLEEGRRFVTREGKDV